MHDMPVIVHFLSIPELQPIRRGRCKFLFMNPVFNTWYTKTVITTFIELCTISGVIWNEDLRSASVFSTIFCMSARYRLFIPGSLNCEAIVPNTGNCSSSASQRLWFLDQCAWTTTGGNTDGKSSGWCHAATVGEIAPWFFEKESKSSGIRLLH